MIPLRDDNPTRGSALATFGLIGVNLWAWVFVQGLGSEPALSLSVCEYGAIAGELLGTLPAGTAVPLGTGTPCEIGPVSGSHWGTALSSMFMHGGWFHLIGNLWFLYVFGDNVEHALGAVRFLALYLLCGLAAVVAQLLSSPASAVPMVGASGAIGGVMGAYAVLFPRARVHVLLVLLVFVTRVVLPAWAMLSYWLLIQLAGGVLLPRGGGGVAFWAHLGGFASGVFLISVFRVHGSTSRFIAPK